MPNRPKTFGAEQRQQAAKQYDRQRGTPDERGYDSWWRTYRKWFLACPESVMCAGGCGRQRGGDRNSSKFEGRETVAPISSYAHELNRKT